MTPLTFPGASKFRKHDNARSAATRGTKIEAVVATQDEHGALWLVVTAAQGQKAERAGLAVEYVLPVRGGK